MQPFQAPRGHVLNHEVDAATILNGQFDPRAFPFPYMAVVGTLSLPRPMVSSLLTAVGMLRDHGWELVSVANASAESVVLVAFLKRADG
jgi:hypothetical protein